MTGRLAHWAATVAAAVPAAGLAAAGGAWGTRGIPLVAVAGLAVGFGLAFVQPWIERRFAPRAATPLRWYLQRALSTNHVSEVARELRAVARDAAGIDRAILIAAGGDGVVHVYNSDDERDLGEAQPAFRWLGEEGTPVRRGDAPGAPGQRAVLELLARLDAEVALPLLHRGLLLGVILLGRGSDAAFERALAAFTTVAITNTHLGMEAAVQKPSRPTDLARALAEALLPDEKPVTACGVRLAGACRIVPTCGGDLWTWQDLGDGKLLLAVGDASGQGAASAMLAAVARGAIDAVRHVDGAAIDPARLLTVLNQAVHRAGRARMQVTMFACVLDAANKKMRFASAGHPFPLALTSGKVAGSVAPLVARGNPLGAVPEAAYASQERALVEGERLVVFTDGLVDAGTPGADPWGDKRLRAALMAANDAPAARLPELLFAAVDKYLVGRPIADDMTVVAVEVQA